MIKGSSKKALPKDNVLGVEVKPILEEQIVEVKPLADKVQAGKVETQEEDYYDASVILDYDGRADPFFLEKKDPAYKYRYLNTNQTNLAKKTSNLLHQGGGWQIVPRKHLIDVLQIKESFISAQNDYRVGNDLVLARMPIELYAKKEAQKIKEANAPMTAVDNRLAGKANELEGYGHDSIKGIQTKEQLGLK